MSAKNIEIYIAKQEFCMSQSTMTNTLMNT